MTGKLERMPYIRKKRDKNRRSAVVIYAMITKMQGLIDRCHLPLFTIIINFWHIRQDTPLLFIYLCYIK